MLQRYSALLLIPSLFLSHIASADFSIDGELKQWHRLTLAFDGPTSSEDAEVIPFLD